jgi:predicted PurR-regulated permease PerM
VAVAAETRRLAHKTIIVGGLTLGLASALFLLWKAAQAVLIVLVGILAAVVFDGGARGVMRVLPIGRRAAISLVLLAAAACLAATFWWSGSTLSTQLEGLSTVISGPLASIDKSFSNSTGDHLPNGMAAEFTKNIPTILGGAADVVTTTFGIAVTAVAVLFLGGFFAWDPDSYTELFISVVPREQRKYAHRALAKSAQALRHWLLAQAVSMAVIFAFTLIALMVIGMPYGFALAFLAGLLTFIPTAGPFIAGVVIVLTGMSASLHLAAYGLLVYVAIQFLESNFITPLVQQEAMAIPPGLAIGLQLVMGALFGIIGVAFAVPFAAAGYVFVKEFYDDTAGAAALSNSQDADAVAVEDFKEPRA